MPPVDVAPPTPVVPPLAPPRSLPASRGPASRPAPPAPPLGDGVPPAAVPPAVVRPPSAGAPPLPALAEVHPPVANALPPEPATPPKPPTPPELVARAVLPPLPWIPPEDWLPPAGPPAPPCPPAGVWVFPHPPSERLAVLTARASNSFFIGVSSGVRVAHLSSLLRCSEPSTKKTSTRLPAKTFLRDFKGADVAYTKVGNVSIRSWAKDRTTAETAAPDTTGFRAERIPAGSGATGLRAARPCWN
jgi:hypothetical protein